jgi:hypothetical protein
MNSDKTMDKSVLVINRYDWGMDKDEFPNEVDEEKRTFSPTETPWA